MAGSQDRGRPSMICSRGRCKCRQYARPCKITKVRIVVEEQLTTFGISMANECTKPPNRVPTVTTAPTYKQRNPI